MGVCVSCERNCSYACGSESIIATVCSSTMGSPQTISNTQRMARVTYTKTIDCDCLTPSLASHEVNGSMAVESTIPISRQNSTLRKKNSRAKPSSTPTTTSVRAMITRGGGQPASRGEGEVAPDNGDSLDISDSPPPRHAVHARLATRADHCRRWRNRKFFVRRPPHRHGHALRSMPR